MSQVSVLEVSRNLKCIFTTSTTIANLQEGTKQRRYLRFGMKASLRLRNFKSKCEEPCKNFRSIKGYKKKCTGPQRQMRQNTANRVKWGQRGQTGLKGSNGAKKDQMRPNGVNWGPILNLIHFFFILAFRRADSRLTLLYCVILRKSYSLLQCLCSCQFFPFTVLW